MIDKNELTLIGRAERVSLPDLAISNIAAKVDTGADASSIWAGNITEKDDGLYVVFFDPSHEQYNGQFHIFSKSSYSITRVSNSFGQKEIRYKIKLKIKIKKRVVKATFTLSDRSQKLYPILLGRKLLHGKFLVDVSKGRPLKLAERERTANLIKEIESMK